MQNEAPDSLHREKEREKQRDKGKIEREINEYQSMSVCVVCVLSADSSTSSLKLTLSGVSARAVLHQDVVEGLIGAVGQLMHSHRGDPLWTHRALWVPSINNAVIPGPADTGTGSEKTPETFHTNSSFH